METVRRKRFSLVTEHYTVPDVARVIPNKGKAIGQDTRILDDSAVFPDLPPFNLRHPEILLEIELPDWLVRRGETLRSFVFEFPARVCRGSRDNFA